MVYCGKPSKGCSSCRERKIRVSVGLQACFSIVITAAEHAFLSTGALSECC